MIYIIICILIILIFIGVLYIKKRLKHEFKLYRDWIIAVDIDEDPVKVRICYIKKINKDGSLIVTVPSLDNNQYVLIWIESKKNFYFKDQVKNNPDYAEFL